MNILPQQKIGGFHIEHLQKYIYYAQGLTLPEIFDLRRSSPNDLVKAQAHNI